MIKNKRNILLLLSLVAMIGCVQNGSSDSHSQISDYSKSTESLKIDTGLVRIDMTPENLTTHRLDSGSNLVFVYERTGVTMVDPTDWEAKFTETLIFQLDSAIGEFEYCDTNLKQIDCKYFWICFAKEIKKEIRNIEKGCINGYLSGDSIMININVNSEFRFGGLMEQDKDRIIRYSTSRR